jgi:hypothetical protein
MNGKCFKVLTQKLIANLSKNEKSIKDLVDMLSSFVLQVAKKDNNPYLLIRYCFIVKFFNLVFAFCFFCLENFEFFFLIFFMLFANKV